MQICGVKRERLHHCGDTMKAFALAMTHKCVQGPWPGTEKGLGHLEANDWIWGTASD